MHCLLVRGHDRVVGTPASDSERLLFKAGSRVRLSRLRICGFPQPLPVCWDITLK